MTQKGKYPNGFRALLTEGVQMAFSLGSQKRYSEAFTIFQRTPVYWKKEKQIQLLAKDVFRQTPQEVIR